METLFMETSTLYHQENQTWSIDWTPFQSKSCNLFCTIDKLILNVCRETKVPEKSSPQLWRTKLEDWHYLTTRLTIKQL